MPRLPGRICSVEGCGKKHYSLGYCVTHYNRVRANGTTDLLPKPTRVSRVCEVEGCGRPHRARGLCQMHARRLDAHGRLEPYGFSDLVGERWRPIPGYEGLYQASSLGRVRSLPRALPREGGTIVRYAGRLLTALPDGRGYLAVSLSVPGERTKRRVHILVASAFIGPRPGRLDINHKNGVKTDNRAANLEYVSRSRNNEHAYALGLANAKRGQSSGRAVLTDEQAKYVLRMKGIKRQRDLAKELGCPKGTIANIHSGRTWRHLSSGIDE